MSRSRLVAAVALVVVTSLSACGSDEQSFQVTQTGNTTLVRHAELGSPQLQLVEELSIGVMEGEEPYMLGSVGRLAVDADGGIYEFDRAGPIIRYFDAEGTYVRTLGAPGEGPGEYGDAVLGMHVRTDGKLIIRDARRRRITLYNPDGSFAEHWELQSGLFTSAKAIVVDDQDTAYLRILTGRPVDGEPWPFGDLRMDAEGNVIDTLHAPVLEDEPPQASGQLQVNKAWIRSPSGAAIVGRTDEYAFEVRHLDGRIVRIEADHDRVAVAPEEKSELEDYNAWRQEFYPNPNFDPEPIPDIKPAFAGFFASQDGRIWVSLHTPAVEDPTVERTPVDERNPPARAWTSPSVSDIFTEEGEYLGRLDLPEGFTPDLIRGDQVWGTRNGEFGEEQIVRFRIETR